MTHPIRCSLLNPRRISADIAGHTDHHDRTGYRPGHVAADDSIEPFASRAKPIKSGSISLSEPLLGDRRLAAAGVDLSWVPGDHQSLSLMGPPNVEVPALCLRECVDRFHAEVGR